MSSHEVELRALMMASLDGEAKAHRVLLERLSRHLRAYYKNKLERIGRSAEEAEELMQDALMAIHTRRDSYDPEQLFTPWVHAIARYKLIDHLRKTKSSMTDVPLEEASEVMAQDDHTATESALDLNRMLAALPDKMRRAIQYVKLDGLSVSEAANKCGMSESAIKVSVHRGLNAMAAAISRGQKA
ncbi:MAG: sigma-70 family RNA polymerase sigma factor [Beijerinckiaceae bacterium]|nr:sigma-70 family RNA polymerase sigma factor [Beijerinckiaceae bacterium]